MKLWLLKLTGALPPGIETVDDLVSRPEGHEDGYKVDPPNHVEVLKRLDTLSSKATGLATAFGLTISKL